jgi:hypothetical protein
LENIGVRFSPDETAQVFCYLDKDSNGTINYKEWCEICEERRREIDPFNKTQTSDNSRPYKTSSSNQSNASKTGSDWLTQELAKFKNQKLKALPSDSDKNFCYGVKNEKGDNMEKVMSMNYQKLYLDKAKVEEDRRHYDV